MRISRLILGPGLTPRALGDAVVPREARQGLRLVPGLLRAARPAPAEDAPAAEPIDPAVRARLVGTMERHAIGFSILLIPGLLLMISAIMHYGAIYLIPGAGITWFSGLVVGVALYQRRRLCREGRAQQGPDGEDRPQLKRIK